MKNLYLLLILIFVCTTSTAQTKIDFYTNMGDFQIEVRENLMPITAGNFIDLVEDEFYDGIIFHRIIADFVIQGGDPLGTGFGGPGYTIMDEYHPDMNHDSTGVIAMAKTSAPNSAGSQFYFTLAPLPNLDGAYAAFGSCIQNIEVLEAIGLVPTNSNDRPLEDVVMDSVRIVQTLTSVKEIETSVRSEVYPNPFRETISINYEVEAAGKINLKVFDSQGRLVHTLIDGRQGAGVHSTQWNTVGIPPGTYYLSIITPEGVGFQKLTKVQ